MEKTKPPASGPDWGLPITLCYGVYVIVIVWVVAFHWTSSTSASATNRRGRSVLPFLMIGTTLALLSMLTDLPFSFATFLPIHSSNVLPSRTIVTFCADTSQVMVPHVASTTDRMGRRVRELRMMGAASREEGFPSTYIVLLPIFSSTTLLVILVKDAVTFLSASIVTVAGFFVPERAPDQPVKA